MENINKIKSLKNGTIDIQSSKEKSGSLSALSKVKESDENRFSSTKDGKPESISSNFSMTVDVRSGNSDNTNAKKPRSHVSYKPEKWMLPQQAEDTLTQLNLAIVCGQQQFFYMLQKISSRNQSLIFFSLSIVGWPC